RSRCCCKCRHCVCKPTFLPARRVGRSRPSHSVPRSCSSGAPPSHSMQAAIEQRVCIHCGTPFRPTAHRPNFCCAGCQFVHDLIAKNGLGQFYDLQEGGVPPVQSLVFQKRDYAWLEDLARVSNGTLALDVQGLSCIGCPWLIERLFTRQPGALA